MRVVYAIVCCSFLALSAEARPDASPESAPIASPKEHNGLNQARADAIKEMFKTSWNGYYEHAFPKDALKPATNSGWNPRNGWAASAVDALDTAIIMGLDDVTHSILTYIPQIDYTVSSNNSDVSLFETTIRYLGGMLSAYDLLNGPYSHTKWNPSEVTALLDQSKKLADTLSFAFQTATGIPYNHLDLLLKTNGRKPSDKNYQRTGLAVAGSLILEWKHLSDLTGDPTYGQLAEKAESYLLDPKPPSNEPFPGLLGIHLSVETGQFLDADGGWDGSGDSFYEYLIKMWIYNPDLYGRYKDRWIAAADSTIKHLLVHPASRPDITFLSRFKGTNLTNDMGHLSCFAGGNFILGGLVLHEQRYIDAGLDITHGCMHTYKATATKIGPEFWSWNANIVPEEQAKFFAKNGFWMASTEYILRPEYIESLYYAYRATGNVSYQEAAWEALVHINYTTRVGSGYSSIWDVDVPDGGRSENNQESFIFAELLKYGYMIFVEDAEIHINSKTTKGETWVYNTEAHPFKIKSLLPPPPSPGSKMATKEQRVFNGSPLQA